MGWLLGNRDLLLAAVETVPEVMYMLVPAILRQKAGLQILEGVEALPALLDQVLAQLAALAQAAQAS